MRARGRYNNRVVTYALIAYALLSLSGFAFVNIYVFVGRKSLVTTVLTCIVNTLIGCMAISVFNSYIFLSLGMDRRLCAVNDHLR